MWWRPVICPQLRLALAKHMARVIDRFREWDDDNSGKITPYEFQKAMVQLGISFPASQALDAASQISALFHDWDPDRLRV